jgi:hypothetical protein
MMVHFIVENINDRFYFYMDCYIKYNIQRKQMRHMSSQLQLFITLPIYHNFFIMIIMTTILHLFQHHQMLNVEET